MTGACIKNARDREGTDADSLTTGRAEELSLGCYLHLKTSPWMSFQPLSSVSATAKKRIQSLHTSFGRCAQKGQKWHHFHNGKRCVTELNKPAKGVWTRTLLLVVGARVAHKVVLQHAHQDGEEKPRQQQYLCAETMNA